MEIKQRFRVRHQADTVWNALADAPFAIQCLPGAELDDSPDGKHYKGRMKVKLGPLSAAFSGEAVVERAPQTRTGTVEWSGVDGRSNSRAKARMVYAVQPSDDDSSEVHIEADIVLTGALAQFARGNIVQDVAARLTAVFAENLQNRLNACASATSAPPEDGRPAPAPAPLQSAELRPMALIWGVLRVRMAARLRRWADRLDPDVTHG
jgi:carbon-monoxide dehydrogenase small subunit